MCVVYLIKYIMKKIFVIVAPIVIIAGAMFLIMNSQKDAQDTLKQKTTISNEEDIITKVVEEEALYKITFTAAWSEETHPAEFPPNPHFSPFVALSHPEEFLLFEENGTSSDGLKIMAETGETNPLDSEIELSIKNGDAFAVVIGKRIDSPGNTSENLLANLENTYVTVVSMIAPSPDWFISGTVNLFEKGDWVDEKTINIMVWDAGTDSGITFTSSDQETNPQEPISLVDFSPLAQNGKVTRMGTLNFERID